MISDKTIKSLPKKEMIRCEVSGKLVPADECEVIVIKIIKHKDVSLNGYSPFSPTKTVSEENSNPLIPPALKKEETLTPDKINKIMAKRTSTIPSDMVDLFRKPGELQDGH